MARPSLKGNNIVLTRGKLAQVPFCNGGFTLSHAFKEDVDGHDEDHSSHRDVHLSAPDFVFGDAIHVDWQCGGCRHDARHLQYATRRSIPALAHVNGKWLKRPIAARYAADRRAA